MIVFGYYRYKKDTANQILPGLLVHSLVARPHVLTSLLHIFRQRQGSRTAVQFSSFCRRLVHIISPEMHDTRVNENAEITLEGAPPDSESLNGRLLCMLEPIAIL